MRIHHLVAFILSGAFLCGLAGETRAAPPVPGYGKVQGKLRGMSPQRARSMTFVVDGQVRTPVLRGNQFQLQPVPVGSHTLGIFDNHGNRGAYVPVEVRASRTTQAGSVRLVAGGQIAGIVSRYEPTTGELIPLAGVEVRAEPDFPVPVEGRRVSGPPPPKIAIVGITNKDGSYGLRGVPQGGYRVTVVVPGLEAGFNFVWVEPGRTSPADFQLRPEIEDGVGTVYGTVTGPEGQPLEGILVQLYPQEIYYPRSAVNQTRGADRGGVPPDSIPRAVFSTLTDLDGRYTLNVATGYLSALVYGDGYEPASAELAVRPRERLEHNFTLQVPPPNQGAAISGTVTDANTGEPLIGAVVTPLIYYAAIYPPGHPVNVITNERGEFEMFGLPAGEVQIQAEFKGYRPETQTVMLLPGKVTRLQFALRPARR